MIDLYLINEQSIVENRYLIRVTRDKRKTSLKEILRRHKINQCELADASDTEYWQISEMCTGKYNDMLLSTSKRICNALNDIINDEHIYYSIHDVFGD